MKVKVENHLITEVFHTCETTCPTGLREVAMDVWVVVDKQGGVSAWTTERQAQTKVELLERDGYIASYIQLTLNKDKDDD